MPSLEIDRETVVSKKRPKELKNSIARRSMEPQIQTCTEDSAKPYKAFCFAAFNENHYLQGNLETAFAIVLCVFGFIVFSRFFGFGGFAFIRARGSEEFTLEKDIGQ